MALFAGAAFGSEPVGPPVGNNRYRGTISPDGDEDDFTGRFLEGERLTVVVRAARVAKTALPLRPVLTLVDPDGLVRTSGIVTSRSGTAATLRNFAVDKSGLWAVRVAGASETSGQFTVSFHVRGAPRVSLSRQTLGGDDAPLERTYVLPGFDGATLDASVTWTAKSRAVGLRSLTDPAGADVLAADGDAAVLDATTRGRRVELRDVALSHGAGDYALTVGIPTGTATYQVQYSVRAPARPSGRRAIVLSPYEPAIDAVTSPVLAPAGTVVRIAGRNFSTTRPPLVRIGSATAANVTVGAGGTTIDAVMPPRTGDAVVGVVVVNPDGQAAARDAYLAYIPPPSVTEILDATTAAPVRTSPAGGGRAVRILGANLEAGLTVSVNGTAAAAPVFVSSGEIRCAMPAAADGQRTVQVSDRWGRSGAAPFTVLYKTPPAFAADPYSPGALKTDSPGTVTISGSGFLESDEVWFAGQQIASTLLSTGSRTIELPGLAPGNYPVRFVDSIGTVVDGPPFPVKEPPVITSVSVIAGPVIGTSDIPLRGGATIRVEGSSFAWNDVITLGGTQATEILLVTGTRKEFIAPPAAAGLAALVITDGTGQSASVADVVRYVGLADATSKRMPLPSSFDDLGAVCGAAADLDGDGLADDLVIASPFGAVHGTRAELTRVLLGDGSGKLTDRTTTSVPAVRTDAAHVDSWDANCIAIGDVDGANGPDVLLAGEASQGGTYRQVRLFRNDGTGAFTLDETSGPDVRYILPVYGYYYYGYYIYGIYGPSQQAGVPRAIALGDLDNDGDEDAVVGTDTTSIRSVYIDPSYVDFTTVPPTIIYPVAAAYNQYVAATRILVNGIADGVAFRDETSPRLPNAGSTKTGATPSAGFHCRDLALADLDGDNALDIVVTWDDPSTVSPYGLSTQISSGKSKDSARVATRVLLNSADAPGTFTDATAAWMPQVSSPEFWQASRLLLSDLDGDGDADLVLVLSTGLDAWTGKETHTRTALRVLRNDGTNFTDVTASAVPPVDAGLSDDWRGDAVLATDADRDGLLDLLVSTRSPLRAADGTAARRLRLLRGRVGLAFSAADRFVEKPQTDSGECDALIAVPDLGGLGNPILLLLGETRPATSPSSARTRAEEWKR